MRRRWRFDRTTPGPNILNLRTGSDEMPGGWQDGWVGQHLLAALAVERSLAATAAAGRAKRHRPFLLFTRLQRGEPTGLVGLKSAEVREAFASLLGRSGPRLGLGSHFLSTLLSPRGSRHTPKKSQSDHTGRRTERCGLQRMSTRNFERERRRGRRRSTQAQAARDG